MPGLREKVKSLFSSSRNDCHSSWAHNADWTAGEVVCMDATEPILMLGMELSVDMSLLYTASCKTVAKALLLRKMCS